MHSWSQPSIPALPPIARTIPPLRLYDTARRQVAPLSLGNTAHMYVCGITPYDATHMGHAATYVTFDLINRIIRAAGCGMRYVQNVTDVDDPLFERAHRDGLDWRELGDSQIELFRSDMQALNVIPPEDYIGAIESIPQVITAVEQLLNSGAAYKLHDAYPDIYFKTDATAHFGYVSHYDANTMAELFSLRGGDIHREHKRNPLDALLWRAAREGEPSWPVPESSTLGPGRPGWHIECAVIALEKLGAPIDIQGGGSDLIYPHHEFSAAHSECLAGVNRFARHYVHSGMLGFDGEKMSKSLGNLVLVSTLTKQGVHPEHIRLALLDGHYRSDRMWTDDLLLAAQNRWQLWKKACENNKAIPVDIVFKDFVHRLSDDLHTVEAMLVIDNWAHETLAGLGTDPAAPGEMRTIVDALLGVTLRS